MQSLSAVGIPFVYGGEEVNNVQAFSYYDRRSNRNPFCEPPIELLACGNAYQMIFSIRDVNRSPNNPGWLTIPHPRPAAAQHAPNPVRMVFNCVG